MDLTWKEGNKDVSLFLNGKLMICGGTDHIFYEAVVWGELVQKKFRILKCPAHFLLRSKRPLKFRFG